MPEEFARRKSSMSALEPPRVNILGVSLSAINIETALRTVRTAIETQRRGYVCVTGVHGIMESQRDIHFGRLLNASLLTKRLHPHRCTTRLL